MDESPSLVASTPTPVEKRLNDAVQQHLRRFVPLMNQRLNPDNAQRLIREEAQFGSINEVRILPKQRRAFVNIQIVVPVTLD